jgi:hypothetical protein
MTRRFVMDEQRFRDLVAGKVVSFRLTRGAIEIILSDIGWKRMATAIGDAIDERLPSSARPPDPPEAREFLPRKRR